MANIRLVGLYYCLYFTQRHQAGSCQFNFAIGSDKETAWNIVYFVEWRWQIAVVEKHRIVHPVGGGKIYDFLCLFAG